MDSPEQWAWSLDGLAAFSPVPSNSPRESPPSARVTPWLLDTCLQVHRMKDPEKRLPCRENQGWVPYCDPEPPAMTLKKKKSFQTRRHKKEAGYVRTQGALASRWL